MTYPSLAPVDPDNEMRNVIVVEPLINGYQSISPQGGSGTYTLPTYNPTPSIILAPLPSESSTLVDRHEPIQIAQTTSGNCCLQACHLICTVFCVLLALVLVLTLVSTIYTPEIVANALPTTVETGTLYRDNPTTFTVTVEELSYSYLRIDLANNPTSSADIDTVSVCMAGGYIGMSATARIGLWPIAMTEYVESSLESSIEEDLGIVEIPHCLTGVATFSICGQTAPYLWVTLESSNSFDSQVSLVAAQSECYSECSCVASLYYWGFIAGYILISLLSVFVLFTLCCACGCCCCCIAARKKTTTYYSSL